MRNAHARSGILLALLSTVSAPPSGGAGPPEPVLHVTFDGTAPYGNLAKRFPVTGRITDAGLRPVLVRGQGVGGSNCIRFPTERACAIVFDGPPLVAAMGQGWSWTLTCWHRRDTLAYGDRHRTVLSLPGAFALMYHRHGPTAPFLKQLRAASGGAKDLWPSAWGHHLSPGKWVFFAFTYDGTRSENNFVALSGTETYPVRMRDARTLSFPGGRLAAATAKGLIIGASAPGKTDGARGAMIDQVRLYVSRNRDSRGALTSEQLEAVRQADVSDDNQRPAVPYSGISDEERRRRESRFWSAPLSARQVDSLTSVFPDWPPKAIEQGDPVSVPRNASVPVLFVVRSGEEATCRIEIPRPATTDGVTLEGKVTTYEARPVPVEANTHGGSNTRAGKPAPEGWHDHFIRLAPFEVVEPLVRADRVALRRGRYHAVLTDLRTAADAEPGLYRGTARFATSSHSATVPFAVRVHRTVMPPDPVLDTTIWLQPNPEWLTNAEPPTWWSERHWQLLEAAGRTLRAFGQSTISTPLILGEHPLIDTVRRADGSYSFDYRKFDRWVELFLSLGFSNIEGWHVTAGSLYTLDQTTGKRMRVVSQFKDEGTMPVLAQFYDSLRQHLQEKGWTSRYLQHQLDEPEDLEWYARLANVARSHLRGVRTIDAIHARNPGSYSDLADVMAFDITRLATHQEMAEARRKQGRTTWLYHCCNPNPPQPNRHLDESLTNSRLYPWLAFLLNADGYLFWGANVYRGADPWKMSVGPGPRGADPNGYTGHPPGDNWLFYPLPEGLTGSMRMVAFRDGLVDHTLLTMLAGRDRKQADAVMRRLARSLFDYERRPGPYHESRRVLLQALDR